MREYNLASPESVLSATGSDFGPAASVLVVDESRTGVTASTLLTEVYHEVKVISTVSLIGTSVDDQRIVETLKEHVREGVWSQVEFVTADTNKKDDSFSNLFNDKDLDGRFSVIRFTNRHLSNDSYVSLLWRLTNTPGFRTGNSRLNKDIRLGTESVYYISDGKRSAAKRLYVPPPGSTEYKRWIGLPPHCCIM